MQGMFGNAIFCCVLLLGAAAGVLGSHFRGGIFMVRPQPGGNETEVKPTMYLRLGGGYIADISKLLEIFAVENFAVFAMMYYYVTISRISGLGESFDTYIV